MLGSNMYICGCRSSCGVHKINRSQQKKRDYLRASTKRVLSANNIPDVDFWGKVFVDLTNKIRNSWNLVDDFNGD